MHPALENFGNHKRLKKLFGQRMLGHCLRRIDAQKVRKKPRVDEVNFRAFNKLPSDPAVKGRQQINEAHPLSDRQPPFHRISRRKPGA